MHAHFPRSLACLQPGLENWLKANAAGDAAAEAAAESAICFNGGGHVNHAIFWQNLSPPSKTGGGEPTGELAALINSEFGSFEVRCGARVGSQILEPHDVHAHARFLFGAGLPHQVQRHNGGGAGLRLGLARAGQGVRPHPGGHAARAGRRALACAASRGRAGY